MSATAATFLSVDLGEWGSMLLAECRHPELDDGLEPWDLGLALQCPGHLRTVYYCPAAGALWCDGYLGGGDVGGGGIYRPHELELGQGRALEGFDAADFAGPDAAIAVVPDTVDVGSDAATHASIYDDPALREAITRDLASMVNDPTTVSLNATRWRAWALMSAVQLASRHPDAGGSQTIRAAVDVARNLQSLVATTPALERVAAAGWDQTLDR